MPPETKIPNNSEIDQALKEFEMKSAVTAMSQAPTAQSASLSDGCPKMVRLVMKLSGGAIKEQRQAEYVLLGFAIVVIVFLFIWFFGGGNESAINQSIIYQEDLTPTARETIPKEVLDTIPYKNAR